MPKPVELTIVIPCLNEAETLPVASKGAAGTPSLRCGGRNSRGGQRQYRRFGGGRRKSRRPGRLGKGKRIWQRAARRHRGSPGPNGSSWETPMTAMTFPELTGLLKKFQEGYDLVMGCRLPSGGGTIMPGAMPWKNRWIGNPVLSFIGQLFFKCPARDFHCGLRGFTRAAFEKMDLQTTGMEFASEMVIKATLKASQNHRSSRHACARMDAPVRRI